MARQPKPSALVPAAARGGELLTDRENELNSAAIDTFLKAVGGRTELTDVLSIGASGGDMDKVTTLLLDPRYERFSIRRVCTMAGVTVADLFASYRKALVTRAHLEATHLIVSKLVPVVDDVMTRAAPRISICPACQGASVAGKAPCSTCGSSGRVQSEPELDRQKLALELGQLTERKGGILMQQNTITAAVANNTAQTGVLEQLQQAVGDLLFAPKRKGGFTDAEIIRDDPPRPRHPFEEEEPPLPFDREEPPEHRRPDLPGMPEESLSLDFDDNDDHHHHDHHAGDLDPDA